MPVTLPEQVRIVETGPRDGLQNEAPCLSPESRVELIEKLQSCGLKTIEAGSFVRPDQVPQMALTEKVIDRLDMDAGVNYPVLVANLTGLENALLAGVKEIAVFAAASETFSQKNINCSIDDSFARFSTMISQGISAGLKVRGYISCVMGCPYEGEVASEWVAEIAQRLYRLGCYEISLGDTIGTGTPLHTRKLVRDVEKFIPAENIAVHFHDTYGQALANIFAALEVGVSVIDASVAGLGGCPYAKGASGNVATEDVVYMLNGLGIEHGVDLNSLISVGQTICAMLNRPVMSRVNQAMFNQTMY